MTVERKTAAVRRVAFLTPEFATEKGAVGGVGNYVRKMAVALGHRGVTAEVFVVSDRDEVIDHEGVRVERVARNRNLARRALVRLALPLTGPHGEAWLQLANARRLAVALERRHGEQAFDVVQSSNYHLTGAHVARAPGRRHVVRISTSRRLFDRAYGGVHTATSRLVEALDVRVMRRADAVYAPSAFLARYYATTYGLEVAVVRPPAELGADPAPVLPPTVPERYLVHFGTLGARKGTDAVAEALELAWSDAPDLRMVWVGPLDPAALERYRSRWGNRAHQVAVLGMAAKDVTYGIVARAAASVLPSTVDNLPNTVIESLILGVPVIGSDGASIDELVEDGASGRLVRIGDAAGLARAMVDAWRGTAPWLGTGFRTPATIEDMRSDRAVDAFVAFVAGIGTPSAP